MNEETNIPKNFEIDQALKEFETKSATDNNYKAVKFYKEIAAPKMIKLVMKLSCGAIKSERQAGYVLLGFVVLAIIISLFLIFGGGKSKISSPKPDLINRPQPLKGYIPR